MGGVLGEVAGKKLYDAASKGDVATFQELLKEDPCLLEVVSFACSRNLLHIATTCGQAGIVEEVLKINPQLARSLDSQNLSPLHIAAAQGKFEIAKKLLSIAPEMCWSRDYQDMNPIHVAAMNGHVEVLEELVQLDHLPAMERVHRGQTALHLCVKHRQQEALKVLVEKLGELVCAKDDDGETILHLAVRCNQYEMIQHLVESKKIEKLTRNAMGKTALDILEESPHTSYSEIKAILISLSDVSLLEVLSQMTETTMVVVVLIATIAFQAAVSPPGGVLQDDSSTHKAGVAVMASTHPKIYKHFVRANTTAFVSSLVTIFLLTTRLPSKNIYFGGVVSYAMWVSLASIAVSYGASLMVITPNMGTQSLSHIVKTVVAVSLTLFGFLVVWVSIGTLYSSWKSKQLRQEDSRNDPLIQRVFYRIFQWFDPLLKDFKADPLRLYLRFLRWELGLYSRIFRRGVGFISRIFRRSDSCSGDHV